MTTTTFPRALNYGIYLAVFIINALVLVTMGYSMSGAIQDKIYTDGTGFLGPMIAAIITAIGIVYVTVILILIRKNVVIPPLASILVDSIILIPGYIIGIVMVGLFVDWEFLGSHVGSCNFRSADDKTWIIDDKRCQMIWHTLEGLEILAMILMFFSLYALFLLLGLLDKTNIVQDIDSGRLRRSNTCTKTAGSSQRGGLSGHTIG
ncbi:hypothetical protein C8J56DRAFT_930894 [Mycena floridula]|nr:hypothetical protein C8J56DRAFT_930894 [Mycena floridula]